MIKISEGLSIRFCVYNNKKAIELSFTKSGDMVCLYDTSFESVMKHFFRYKADIGDYPTIKQSTDLSTQKEPGNELK